MIEGIPVADYSGPTIMVLVAILVITRRLVWHTDLKKVEARLARLEELLWVSVGITERTTDVLADAEEERSP
jgi:hypothetical protein